MEFKYAMKGEDGSEVFEDGVVLARQFLGKGAWLVWDLRVDGERSCPQCSSDSERLVCHERGTRCPKVVLKNIVGQARGLLAQEAVAARTACLASAAAREPVNGEEAGAEVAVEGEVVDEEAADDEHVGRQEEQQVVLF